MRISSRIIIPTMIIMLLLSIATIILTPDSFLLLIVCQVFVIMLAYSLQSFENHIFLFCFLVCFFTYLLSGQVANRILHVYQYDFDDRIELHTDLSLLISLVGLFLGYIIAQKTVIRTKYSKPSNVELDFNSTVCLQVRRISKLVYYITYVFYLLVLIDKVIFVYRNGYLSYYVDYETNINFLFRIIGSVTPSALCLFLATMPEKRDVKWPLISYVLYLLLSLGTGRRINFMTGIVFLFAYCLCRNSIHPDPKKPWISKKLLVRILIAIPLLLVAMYMYEYIRSDFYTTTNYSPFVGFFIRQGTSINVIKFAEKYKSGLDESALYSFYNTLRWLQGSLINRLFDFGLDFHFGSQSELTALHGSNLADYISYNAMRFSYLRGAGWGSCYIAELYVDFGYFGVFFGNFLYGTLLSGILKGVQKKSNIWLTACGLLITDSLFKAPRASFDGFMWNFVYIYNWGIILLVYFYMKLCQSKQVNKNLHQLQKKGD